MEEKPFINPFVDFITKWSFRATLIICVILPLYALMTLLTVNLVDGLIVSSFVLVFGGALRYIMTGKV